LAAAEALVTQTDRIDPPMPTSEVVPAPALEQPWAQEASTTRANAAGLTLVCVLAFVAMAPSLHGTFLSGDDEYFVRDYSLVNRPSVANAVRLFSVIHRDLYQPVPMLSFALDTAVFGDRAWGFHLTNILWHVAAAALVWILIKVRFQNRLLATATAALFAVHPQAVESAATITARIVVMGIALSLAAILSFLIWSRQPKGEGGWLATAILCTLLAMMSKVQAGLPALMLLVVYGQQRRSPRLWWSMWGLLTLISVGFTLLALWTTVRSGLTERALANLAGSVWGRALLGMGIYLTHYVWPVGLSPWYVAPSVWTWWKPQLAIGAMGLAGGVSLAILCHRRRLSAVAVGLGWYLIAILPFLGASAARNLIAADRYTYLANVGLHLVVATLFVLIADRWLWTSAKAGRDHAGAPDDAECVEPPGGTPAPLDSGQIPVGQPYSPVILAGLGLAAVGLLAAMIGASWVHIGHYRTGVAYSARVAALYPDATRVQANLGFELARAGRFDEAQRAADAEMANPRGDKARAYQLLGWITQERGQFDLAEKHYRTVVQMLPGDPMAHYRLARLLRRKGRLDEAVAEYKQALKAQPDHLPTLMDMAGLYDHLGRRDEAADCLRRALRINPQHVEALTSLATIALRQGNTSEAEQLYRNALEVNPENAQAHTNLAIILAQSDRASEAMEHYNEALLLEPRLASARMNRAELYAAWNHYREAAEDYGTLLSMDPVSLPALEALSDILLKAFSEGAAARTVQLWEVAVKAGGAQPRLLAGLAWAQAVAKMDDRAEQNARKCLGPKGEPTLAHLTLALVALHRNQVEEAIRAVEQACSERGPTPAEDIDRAARAIGLYGTSHPEQPLPYFLVGRLLLALNRVTMAGQTFGELMQVTKDPIWADRIKKAMDDYHRGAGRSTTHPQTTSARAATPSAGSTRPAR
jgi:tetratricopeptide (TPR) repeat protein